MAKTYNYTFGETSLIVGGTPIKGRVAVRFTYPNDVNTVTFSQDGDGVFSQSSIYNWAEVEIELSQAALDNLNLTTKLKLNAVMAIGFKDNTGNSIHFLPAAKFTKVPDTAYEGEAGTRTWMLQGFDEGLIIGGN